MGKQVNKDEKPITITWADVIAKKDQKYASDTLRKNQEPINKDAIDGGTPDKRSAKDRLYPRRGH